MVRMENEGFVLNFKNFKISNLFVFCFLSFVFSGLSRLGILLCTEKGQKLVEYALSGMDEKLFVSKYLLELPQKELLQNFIQNELIKWNR